MGFEFKIAEKIEKLKIDGMTCREIANKLGFYSKFEVGEIQKVLDSMVSSKKLKTRLRLLRKPNKTHTFAVANQHLQVL